MFCHGFNLHDQQEDEYEILMDEKERTRRASDDFTK